MNTSALTPTAVKAASPGFDDSTPCAAHGSADAATFEPGDGAGIQGLPSSDFFDPSDYCEPDPEDVITEYSKIRGE